MFTPEFRNRLDAIISFAALDKEIILRVVDKFLMQLEEQLHEKKVDVVFTDALKDYLAKNRLRPAHGRPPHGAPDSGHHTQRTGRRTAVRQAGERRQGHRGREGWQGGAGVYGRGCYHLEADRVKLNTDGGK